MHAKGNLSVLCPPSDEVTSRSPSVLNNIPSLSPSATIGKNYIGAVAIMYAYI